MALFTVHDKLTEVAPTYSAFRVRTRLCSVKGKGKVLQLYSYIFQIYMSQCLNCCNCNLKSHNSWERSPSLRVIKVLQGHTPITVLNCTPSHLCRYIYLAILYFSKAVESTPLQCSLHSGLESRLKMLIHPKNTNQPEDSHPSHIPNHLRVTLFESFIALLCSDTSMVHLPSPLVLFPLVEFIDKLSLLQVPVPAVSFVELQFQVPEQKNTKQ